MYFQTNMNSKLKLIVLLIAIIIGFKLYDASCVKRDNFTNCGLIKNNYSECYDSGDCTIMLDLEGNSFCTSKK